MVQKKKEKKNPSTEHKKRLHEKKGGGRTGKGGFIPAAPGQVDLAESIGIESSQRLGKPTQGQPTGDKCPRVMLPEVRGTCSQGY